MMFAALKKYAVFTGRARRKEYWLFVLLYIIALVVTTVIDAFTGTLDPMSGIGILSGLVYLGFFVPGIAVIVRRLHDIDKSGWWALIMLVPLIGGIALLVFMCLDGTKGDNRFGPDPKADERVTEDVRVAE